MESNRKTFLAAISKLQLRPADWDAVLTDLLTPAEYAAVVERFRIFQELQKGATVQQVCDRLGVASATVVRGNRVIKYGTGGAATLTGGKASES